MRGLLFLPLLMAGLLAGCTVESDMTQQAMERIVKHLVQDWSGGGGVAQFSYGQVRMALISDPGHDRMRIIAPIKAYQALGREQVDAVLEANFHTALDARYAVSGGVLYAAYIHPLAALTWPELESAVHQVANLVLTFGNGYTGGGLQFGGGIRHPGSGSDRAAGNTQPESF